MARAEKYKVRRSAEQIREGQLKRNRISKREENLINKAHQFHKSAEATVLLIVSYGTKFQVYTTCPGNPAWKPAAWMAMEKDYPPPEVETPGTWDEFLAEQKRKRAERDAERARKAADTDRQEQTAGNTVGGDECDNSLASGVSTAWSPSHGRDGRTSSAQQGSQFVTARFAAPQQEASPRQTQHPFQSSVTPQRQDHDLRANCPQTAAGLPLEQPLTPQQQQGGPQAPATPQMPWPFCQQEATEHPPTSTFPHDDLLSTVNDVLGFTRNSGMHVFGPTAAPLTKPRVMRLQDSPLPEPLGTFSQASPPSPSISTSMTSEDEQSQSSSEQATPRHRRAGTCPDTPTSQNSQTQRRQTRANARREAENHTKDRVIGRRVRKTRGRCNRG